MFYQFVSCQTSKFCPVILFFHMNLAVRHESAETRNVVLGLVFVLPSDSVAFLAGRQTFHQDSDGRDCLGRSDQTV